MIEKVFFQPGDLVTLKQDIPNKPVMIVVKKETKIFKLNNPIDDKKKTVENNPIDDKKKTVEYFIGIRCRWFTTNEEFQEAVWNTKDLIKIENK